MDPDFLPFPGPAAKRAKVEQETAAAEAKAAADLKSGAVLDELPEGIVCQDHLFKPAGKGKPHSAENKALNTAVDDMIRLHLDPLKNFKSEPLLLYLHTSRVARMQSRTPNSRLRLATSVSTEFCWK